MDTREETVEDSPVILLLSMARYLSISIHRITSLRASQMLGAPCQWGVTGSSAQESAAGLRREDRARICTGQTRLIATIQVHSQAVWHIRQCSESRPVHDPGDGVVAKGQILQSRQPHKPSGGDGGQVGVATPLQKAAT
jgi:hypothetical protein